jgi:hypothetical protein
MDALQLTGRRCKACGFEVAADRSKARAGMTARHNVTTPGTSTRALCKGSRVRYEEQPDLATPWTPEPAVKLAEGSVTEPKPSPFRKVLARLRGRSVTHVDFEEARRERALGHVTERAHARRFIRQEVRDV